MNIALQVFDLTTSVLSFRVTFLEQLAFSRVLGKGKNPFSFKNLIPYFFLEAFDHSRLRRHLSESTNAARKAFWACRLLSSLTSKTSML
jgi:hypothetical protein